MLTVKIASVGMSVHVKKAFTEMVAHVLMLMSANRKSGLKAFQFGNSK